MENQKELEKEQTRIKTDRAVRAAARRDAVDAAKTLYLASNWDESTPLRLDDLCKEILPDHPEVGEYADFLSLVTKRHDEDNWHGRWKLQRRRYLTRAEEKIQQVMDENIEFNLSAIESANKIQAHTNAFFLVLLKEIFLEITVRMEDMRDTDLLKLLELGQRAAKNTRDLELDNTPGGGALHGKDVIEKLSELFGAENVNMAVDQIRARAQGRELPVKAEIVDTAFAERALNFEQIDARKRAK